MATNNEDGKVVISAEAQQVVNALKVLREEISRLDKAFKEANANQSEMSSDFSADLQKAAKQVSTLRKSFNEALKVQNTQFAEMGRAAQLMMRTNKAAEQSYQRLGQNISKISERIRQKQQDELRNLGTAAQLVLRSQTKAVASEMRETQNRMTEIAAVNREEVANARMIAADRKALASQIASINKDEVANAKMVSDARAQLGKELSEQNKDEVANAKMIAEERKRLAGDMVTLNKDEIGTAKMIADERKRIGNEIATQNKDEVANARMIADARKEEYRTISAAGQQAYQMLRLRAGEAKRDNKDFSESLSEVTRATKLFNSGVKDQVKLENDLSRIRAERRALQGDDLAQLRNEITERRRLLKFYTEQQNPVAAKIQELELNRLYQRRNDILEKSRELRSQERAAEAASKREVTEQVALQKILVREQLAETDLDKQKLVVKRLQLELDQEITRAQGKQTEKAKELAERLRQAVREQNRLKEAMQGGAGVAVSGNNRDPLAAAAASMSIRQATFDLHGGADLFRLQTQVLANYALVANAIYALQAGARFVMEFEASLAQLQAITGSTATEMQRLEHTFINLAQNSRYTAKEISDSALVMAQAGLSTNQIQQSIDAVLKLATATGTDLPTAVDIATSAMGVFHMRAAEMENVANTMTAALNVSKLDAEKLALGMQYAGNMAAEVGISFTELNTVLATMANTGIKSGSTLGTGLSTLITDLLAPTDKLKGALASVGVTMEDIDIRTQGFVGVIKNLYEAGFTSAMAFDAMEVRGARALTALFNQIGNIDSMGQAIAAGGNAAEAAATQMDTLQAQWTRFTNSLGTAAVAVGEPITEALKSMLSIGSEALAFMVKYKEAFQIVGTVVGATAAMITTKWIGGLALGLLSTSRFALALADLTTNLRMATTAGQGFALVGEAISKNWVSMGLTAAFVAAAFAFEHFNNKVDETKKQLERIDTAINETKGRLDEARQVTGQATEAVLDLTTKYSRLSQNSNELSNYIRNLNNQFRDMGIYIRENGTSIDDLIRKMRELQQQSLQTQRQQLTILDSQLQSKVELQRQGLTRINEENQRAINDTVPVSIRLSQTTLDEAGPQSAAAALKALQVLDQERSRLLGLSANENNLETVKATLAESTKRLNEVDAQLIGKDRERFKSVIDAMVALREVISNNFTKIGEYETLKGQRDITQRELEKVDVSLSEAGQMITGFVAGMNTSVSKILDTVDKATQGGSADAAARARSQALSNLAQTAEKDANALVEKLKREGTYDGVREAGLLAQMEQNVQDLKKKAKDAELDLLNKDKEVLKVEEQRVKRQIASTEKIRGNRYSENEIAAARDRLYGLYDNLTDIQTKIADIERKETSLSEKTTAGLMTADEIRATNQEALLSSVDQTNEFLESAALKMGEAADKVGRVPDAAEKLGNAIDDINAAFDAAVAQAQRPLNRQNAALEGMNLQSNRNSYSDVQRTAERNRLEELNRQFEYSQLNLMAQKRRDMEESLVNAAADLEAFSTQRQGLEGQISPNQDIEKNLAIQKRIDEYKRQERELAEKIRDINREILAVEVERDTLAENLAYKYERQVEPMSLGQGFREAWKQWTEESGNARDFNVRMTDSFKTMFSSISDGMGQLVRDMVSGTMSISDAFRNMANKVIDAMLDMAAQEAAAGLMGLGKSLLGSLLGGYSTSDAGMASLANTGSKFRQGGMIRAAQGAIPTRDSVHVLAMPGEAILQRSAVSSLGEGFVRDMNARGAAALERFQKPVMVTNEKKEPDSVNVWVVSPDQVPPPGPRDIIATVAQDIATGGVTKKLIKQVQMGVV